MKRPRHDLTEGPVGGHIRRLALAMGWGIVAMNAVQFTDMWFISRLGHDELAAIAFTLPVTGFLFYMVLAMSSGMTSASARAFGAGRLEHAARIVTAGVIAAGLLGLVMTVLALAIYPHVFRAMGAPAGMLPMIAAYMDVWLWALPFMSMCIVANSGARGAGEGVLPALIMLLLALVNLVLSPLFIFWLGLGIKGSAWATLLAYIVAMSAALGVTGGRLHLLKFRTLRNGPKTRTALKTWAGVVIPVSVAYSIEPLSAGILTATVAPIGIDAVAAYGIAARVEGIAFIMLMALWGAVTPLAGQNWAAGKRARVRHSIDVASLCNGVFCIAFAGLMWLYAKPLAQWFSDSAQTVALASLYLTLVPVTYVGFGAGGLIGSALNGIGRAHWYLVTNGLRVVLLLAFAVYGAYAFGFLGFAVGVGAANLLGGALMVVWARGVFLAYTPNSQLSPDQPMFP